MQLPPKQLSNDVKPKSSNSGNSKEKSHSDPRASTGFSRTGVNKVDTQVKRTPLIRTSVSAPTSSSDSSTVKQTPADSKTLSVNVKLRNLKNIEEQEKLAKSERVLAEAELIALQLMTLKMNGSIEDQRTKAFQVTYDLAQQTRQLRKRNHCVQTEIDEKRAWANLLQVTQSNAVKLNQELHLAALVESLQTIQIETEQKNTTLPLLNFENATHFDGKLNIFLIFIHHLIPIHTFC